MLASAKNAEGLQFIIIMMMSNDSNGERTQTFVDDPFSVPKRHVSASGLAMVWED